MRKGGTQGRKLQKNDDKVKIEKLQNEVKNLINSLAKFQQEP